MKISVYTSHSSNLKLPAEKDARLYFAAFTVHTQLMKNPQKFYLITFISTSNEVSSADDDEKNKKTHEGSTLASFFKSSLHNFAWKNKQKNKQMKMFAKTQKLGIQMLATLCCVSSISLIKQNYTSKHKLSAFRARVSSLFLQVFKSNHVCFSETPHR